MITFEHKGRSVFLVYESEFEDSKWVQKKLRDNNAVTISQAFTFTKDDLISKSYEEDDVEYERPFYRFRFAVRRDGYFYIAGRILGIDNDILIADQGIKLNRKLFVAERNIKIFPHIAKVKQDADKITIGGDRKGNIPIASFRQLLKKFPNTTELNYYAQARIEMILGEYFNGIMAGRERYEAYLRKTKTSVSDTPLEPEELLQAEIDKFIYVRDLITDWLGNANAYSERDWQKLIVKVILLIFPKYVAVLEEVSIPDYYTKMGNN